MDHDWEEYRKYLRSPKWNTRKESYFSSHEKKCRRCSSRTHVQLHHLDYANLGKEPDSDLVPLCRDCHFAVHLFHRKNGGNLRTATLKIIRSYEKKPTKPAKYQPKKFQNKRFK